MIGMVAAYGKANRVIGIKGRLPWDIPEDLHRFHDLTTGKAIVMGRKTYESIGRPLPNRLNIVLSGSRVYEGENLVTARTMEEAIALAGDKDLMVAGGGSIYEMFLPVAEKLFLTEVDYEGEGDAFFPAFDVSLYDREVEAQFTDEPLAYTFVTYTRKDQ